MQTELRAHRAQALTQPRTFVFWLLIAAIVLANPGRAWAHAVIVESTPAANGVVTGPELEIKLRFNARIDGARSKLTLISPDGGSRVIALAQQTSPDLLLAKAAHLVPGNYQLRWQVLASDGHITQGNIPFSVVHP
jgi:methionine-rich copper-binding protein CopC